jgi:hypothetical protein
MGANHHNPSVTFRFDPTCPWTWLTSRWATEAAAARGVQLGWRALSLRVLNEGRIDEEHRPVLDASFAALRLVEALADAGHHDDAGRFYTELGQRIHAGGRTPSMHLVEEAAVAAGLGDLTPTLRDETWDDAVTRSTKEAVEAAGGEVGSPVLWWHDADVAMFGPIVNPAPTGKDALELWDLVPRVAGIPTFYSVQRGGKGQPQVRSS